MGQDNRNGAGISPAPFLIVTHILTHNTVIYNGESTIGDNLTIAKIIDDGSLALDLIGRAIVV